jgi:hypothetical protein
MTTQADTPLLARSRPLAGPFPGKQLQNHSTFGLISRIGKPSVFAVGLCVSDKDPFMGTATERALRSDVLRPKHQVLIIDLASRFDLVSSAWADESKTHSHLRLRRFTTPF